MQLTLASTRFIHRGLPHTHLFLELKNAVFASQNGGGQVFTILGIPTSREDSARAQGLPTQGHKTDATTRFFPAIGRHGQVVDDVNRAQQTLQKWLHLRIAIDHRQGSCSLRTVGRIVNGRAVIEGTF